MRALAAKLASLACVLFLVGSVGCVIKTSDSGGPVTPSNDPELTTGEQPILEKVGGSAQVGFARAFGQPLEAWEVSTKFNETYLNYSRFPYGTANYKGQAVQVCSTVVGLNKYVGISENTIRLKKAMILVIVSQTQMAPTYFNCSTYETMVAKNPRSADLDKVFDSL